MLRFRKRMIAALVSSTLVMSPASKADEINTKSILSATKNVLNECMAYHITGICIFLDCSPKGCSINTSPKIEHYYPDMVVTAQESPNENPWTEMKNTFSKIESQGLDKVGKVLTKIDGDTVNMQTSRNPNLRFKETTATGHPLGLIRDSGSIYFCPSSIHAYKPYFTSILDYGAWRYGIPDKLTEEAWVPGKREIGSMTTSDLLGNTWGSVYPRMGSVIQQSDAKAAAVTAQRTVDIVTRRGEPHQYFYAKTKKSNEKTDKWQMLHPKEDDKCEPFGNTDEDWGEGRINKVRNYAWNYWPKYNCCLPASGMHIKTVSIPPIEVPVEVPMILELIETIPLSPEELGEEIGESIAP